MKKVEEYKGFEQGPIRPPSEAESLLIRISRNCPWNRCTFCPVYKGTTFSLRPVEHVLRDIDTVKWYVDAILEARRTGSSLENIAPPGQQQDNYAINGAYNFISGGMKSIFLQDGNSLIIKPDDLIRILRHLRQAFPNVERVTSYARSHTIARISDDHLAQMAEAGLNRIHIGMESGSDEVLKMVKKGTDKATQIHAGKKIKRAGMQLSEYYMPGLGGKSLWQENAEETADALNQINPDFIRLRTLAMPTAAPLTQQFRNNEFDKMGEVDTSRELLLFLESLDGITSTVRSDHVLNLFPEVDGVLPGDKEQMMRPVREFLELEPEEQLLFCIGRRTHRISSIGDLKSPVTRGYAQQMCDQFGVRVDNMDQVIDRIMQRYI
ncbi:radical SAM protein [Desulfosediminicola ganghwensis]|uniref:radical SAM protein n=1 Tax=Desulfosediminicola ganghwensis TaxID=2569540 RepID=UPI0010AD14D4|nr:radical SAM protein [Desulfosediminicola ganghwensis]